MSQDDTRERSSEEAECTDSNTTIPSVTRRRTLSLAATGLAAGAIGTAQADNHDAEVWQTDGTWYAANDGTVYEGPDHLDAIQAAVDSLTAGRTSKETVLIKNSGTVGPHSWDGDVKAVDLPSYTVIDHNGTISVEDTGEDLIVPFRAQSVESIEIQNVTIEGNPRYGIWVQSCSDVQLGTINMSLWDTETIGIGIRIDDSDGGRSQNVSLDYAFVEGSQHHGVETYGVDDLTIGTVETVDTGGCGLLLNDTAYATVDHVDATRADQGGGYAGFRCANSAGPEIVVNRVDAVDCGRGIFTVSGSEGIEIYNIYLDGNGGNLVQDTRYLLIDSGTVTNTGSSGIRIDSRDSADYPHTSDVTIRNLDITGNAEYGVYETGPDTESNAIVNNYFCNNASGAIETYANSTEVSGNSYCG
ncbi:right-handed parallel beta-helix repeat-containing protein (plasmid) [Haloterrigena salifodinae]|uniref:Right-handed parallel beta-helix repeat-containing protein n=1 Tax=Haloterrigena salifodinae TaxID=2675099 RepID=A0A8T8E8M3_9EURY|nr:right-handed parallel beta-helix repeat-containing protein [Haloterrigena salifodinae]QRV17786.1 right-handed parallel beta-helix repeat-containing protein [Haloterrigena salifodinae]